MGLTSASKAGVGGGRTTSGTADVCGAGGGGGGGASVDPAMNFRMHQYGASEVYDR